MVWKHFCLCVLLCSTSKSGLSWTSIIGIYTLLCNGKSEHSLIFLHYIRSYSNQQALAKSRLWDAVSGYLQIFTSLQQKLFRHKGKKATRCGFFQSCKLFLHLTKHEFYITSCLNDSSF